MIYPILVSFIVRGTQLITNAVSLALTCLLVDFYWELEASPEKSNFLLTTTILSLLYIIGLFILSYWRQFINIGIVLVIEVLLSIFWLASFVCLAVDDGSKSCKYYHHNFCYVATLPMAFGVVNFSLFLVSMLLIKKFSFDPIRSVGGDPWLINTFYPGILFWDEKAPDGYKDEGTAPKEVVGGKDGDVIMETVDNRV